MDWETFAIKKFRLQSESNSSSSLRNIDHKHVNETTIPITVELLKLDDNKYSLISDFPEEFYDFLSASSGKLQKILTFTLGVEFEEDTKDKSKAKNLFFIEENKLIQQHESEINIKIEREFLRDEMITTCIGGGVEWIRHYTPVMAWEGQKYKYYSSENYLEYLAAMSISDVEQEQYRNFIPTVFLEKNGDKYSYHKIPISKKARTVVVRFKLGEEVEYENFDGRPVKSVFTMEGNVLKEVQQRIKESIILRKFTETKMIATCVYGDVSCTRWYKRDVV